MRTVGDFDVDESVTSSITDRWLNRASDAIVLADREPGLALVWVHSDAKSKNPRSRRRRGFL
jgi:hypothetical protein